MNSETQYKIAIADDERLFLSGLSMIINEHPQLKSVISANDGQDLLNQLELVSSNLPDLILCDMEMPNLNGIETTKALNEKYPQIKIIILSSYYDPTLILKMLEMGASAYMPKNEEPEEVFATILGVLKNGFHYNEFVMKVIREKLKLGKQESRPSAITLTSRETEILNLICQQKTNQEIGNQLYISKRTVEGHRNNLLVKTNSKNTAGLIIFAIKYGHLDIDIKNNQWNKF